MFKCLKCGQGVIFVCVSHVVKLIVTRKGGEKFGVHLYLDIWAVLVTPLCRPRKGLLTYSMEQSPS
jgi:hypothetical protein